MDRPVIGTIDDLARAVVTTAGVTLAGWVSVGEWPVLFAQTFPDSATVSLAEFALRQGGALVVLVLVLFFYRRDYRDLTEYKQNKDRILTELIAASTEAKTKLEESVKQNTEVSRQVSDVMRKYLQRDTDWGPRQ